MTKIRKKIMKHFENFKAHRNCKRIQEPGVRSQHKLIFFFIPYFLLSLLLLPLALSAENLLVITSIFPLKEFAQAVGGERVNVTLLLPPGAEPHTWEPKPSDVVGLSKADIFIYIGAQMEPWVNGVLKAVDNPKVQVIEASQGLLLLGTEQAKNHPPKEVARGGFDPHIWLNFEYDQKIVDTIVKVLSKKDPDGSEYYQRNGGAYKQRLRELDLNYKNGLSNCGSREFVLGGHAAFAYLAQKYGLKQVALYGISPNSEPTPQKMAEVIEMAKKYRVQAIYFEELVSDKLAKAIAKEVRAKTLVLNDGANLTRTEIKSKVTFISIMEKNLENLKYGLNCQ